VMTFGSLRGLGAGDETALVCGSLAWPAVPDEAQPAVPASAAPTRRVRVSPVMIGVVKVGVQPG
jgi:hypothetical protein